MTDDPEPTRTGGWENYIYVSGAGTGGVVAGQAGLELNYGAAPDLQLSATVPEGYVLQDGLRAGLGDLDVGAKYRFLHAPRGSWLPDAAVFPALTVPTGLRSLGAGHVALFVPVWLEKDFGAWSVFGGGGYTFNPDAGQRNYGLAGVAVTRRFGERLNLGVEIYHQSASVEGGRAATNVGFGVIYQVVKHWALMASGGPGLGAGGGAFYVSLQFTD